MLLDSCHAGEVDKELASAAPGQTSGRETIRSAYAAAIEQRYRFFSYGDAMFIV